MERKRILVIGGAGYIGGLTTDILVRTGHEVLVYDSLLYENHFLKDVPFEFGDIRDTDKLLRISDDFDIIILLAALVGDPACSVNPEMAKEINYYSVKRYVEKLPQSKHIIFMSTCSVYGAQDGILDENSAINPLSVYASTKAISEKIILDRNGTVFRLGTVFGLGDSYSRIRLDLVVNILTLKAVKNRKITINGGEQWRPIIAVKDIAEYIRETADEDVRGLYILSLENVVIRELGEKVANLIPGTEIEYNDMSFEDTRNYRVDNAKAMSRFSYKTMTSVDDEVTRLKRVFEEGRISDTDNIIYHNGLFLKDKYGVK